MREEFQDGENEWCTVIKSTVDNGGDSGGTVRFDHSKAIGALANVRETWGDGRKGGTWSPQRCAARGRREMGTTGEKVASKTVSAEGDRVGLWPQGQERVVGKWIGPGGPCSRVKPRGAPRGSLSKTDVLPWSDQVPWEPLGLPTEGGQRPEVRGQRPEALLECPVSQSRGSSPRSPLESCSHTHCPIVSLWGNAVLKGLSGPGRGIPESRHFTASGSLFPTGGCLWPYDGQGEEHGPFTLTC